MPEAADDVAAAPTPPMPGKAQRVVGTFVLMIGAGLILDVGLVWGGVPLMLIGGVLFAWGVLRGRADGTEVRP